jgi:hypothetical protein
MNAYDGYLPTDLFDTVDDDGDPVASDANVTDEDREEAERVERARRARDLARAGSMM